ncbi:MAG: S1 RNA-binding domain-containing protein [Desulfomonilaceae bacterium]
MSFRKSGLEIDNAQQDIQDAGEDFASLFESGQYDRETFVQRDAKVEGSVVSIGEDWIFVDIGAKTEACIAREELADDKGVLTVGIGDTLSGYVVSTRDGEIVLSQKMTAAASEDAMRSAYRSGIPVEGLVVGERKGGYTVSVFGKQAFCPFSQIDLPPIADGSAYVNGKYLFRIAQYAEGGRNIVLSRRSLLEEERQRKVAALKESLQVGDVLEGVVTRTAQFGAFVDLGGIDGLVPISEIAWDRVSTVSDVVLPGDAVRVKILELDWTNKRISLSIKQALADPWDAVPKSYDEERIVEGVVTRLMNFGAFVQLEPGVEGLIHISNLGVGRRINHPREVVSEGDRVQVRILSIDPQARRISLELVPSGIAEGLGPAEIHEGDILVGAVEGIKEYGVFVSLPGGRSGLLHFSEVSSQRRGDPRSWFTVGEQIEVQAIRVEEGTGRISLSMKSLERREEEANLHEFSAHQIGKSSFGTLGDLLAEKFRKQ